MTVKQLKDELSKYPDNMDVYIAERKTEYYYGLLNSIKKEEIQFAEDPDGDVFPGKETVIILDEE